MSNSDFNNNNNNKVNVKYSIFYLLGYYSVYILCLLYIYDFQCFNVSTKIIYYNEFFFFCFLLQPNDIIDSNVVLYIVSVNKSHQLSVLRLDRIFNGNHFNRFKK